MSTGGFRQGFATVIAAIRGTLATDSLAGSVNAAGFKTIQGSAILVSGLVDFLAAANEWPFTSVGDIPAGAFFMPTAVTRLLIPAAQMDGTVTSGVTASMGNDAARTNYTTSSTGLVSTAGLNNIRTQIAAGADGGWFGFGANPAAPSSIIYAGNPMFFKITVPAVPNTATKCKGYFITPGTWFKP